MEDSFLGRGWGFPPTFSEGGQEVRMVGGETDIRESLMILLATQFGERTMFSDFGCSLDQFLFEEIDQSLVSGIRGAVSDAILNYEPRIDLEEVDVSDDRREEGILLIHIRYLVRTTNNRYNLVYPFYINEASISIT